MVPKSIPIALDIFELLDVGEKKRRNGRQVGLRQPYILSPWEHRKVLVASGISTFQLLLAELSRHSWNLRENADPHEGTASTLGNFEKEITLFIFGAVSVCPSAPDWACSSLWVQIVPLAENRTSRGARDRARAQWCGLSCI